MDQTYNRPHGAPGSVNPEPTHSSLSRRPLLLTSLTHTNAPMAPLPPRWFSPAITGISRRRRDGALLRLDLLYLFPIPIWVWSPLARAPNLGTLTVADESGRRWLRQAPSPAVLAAGAATDFSIGPLSHNFVLPLHAHPAATLAVARSLMGSGCCPRLLPDDEHGFLVILQDFYLALSGR
jgi:hypothetical protein